MNIRRFFKRWAKSREPRLLVWGIPALVGLAVWLAFGIYLLAGKPWQTQAHYTRIAAAALAAKDFETARIASQRLLALGVEPRRKYLFDLALALGGLGRGKEAVSLLGNIAPDDKPGYLPAHLFVAQTLLVKTNATPVEMRIAETHLKHAIALDPNSPAANELLGRLYVRSGRWELAEKHLRVIVSAKPEISLLLAAAHRARGDNLAARNWAERAAKYHRDKVQASKLDLPSDRLAWADAMAMTEDYATASLILEAGWQQFGNQAYLQPLGEVCALWLKSIAQTRPGDLASQITLIERGLECAPQNETLLRHLIRLTHLEGPEAAAARHTLKRMLAEGKAAATLHFALGVDAWQQGHPEEALKHLELAYAAAPLLPQVANNMAMILTVGNKPDLPRALMIIESVLQKFPQDPVFRQTRGEILVRSGRSQAAIADLEYALPRLASKRATHAALAEAYRAVGLRDLATEHERMAKTDR
ncbi:MAG TPA: tetratricopeptide repeat protein [Verrucomicrobiota bacterium]|jgi:tetratricopeptide (TPR) repeat protein|nr:MAG: Tetratricopeptide repeat protein [Candidatus Hydrogenedentes bacterium ADurb.Bin101]HNW08672.1 tetratricopeptide repeat protein [Verrucomicrobiota bacterium]HOX63881.1 tetratricopeptide repeat protein [Verrucomicrobiota bacterium]HPI66240.1 tetratricopeptide repeat protein [Verrucomicrobiota bacterium]HPV94010.1 tetratricopeptide repeat protein [Verrucomicrobiota bacterium]